MKFINNGNSFLLSAPASIFAAEIKNELKRHTMFNGEKKQIIQSKRLADALFILWAGGAALLSYSLVYALRKPFTAAGFDGLDFFGMDYKTATSIVQISGYFISKLIGIKVISELKKENRLKFIILSVAVAELSLVLFGALPRPLNVFALFFNGLSLGCMWGVIFSFLEGRRVTDLLASLMGLSIAISSGTAKSVGLFVMEHLHISEFWMPAFIGAFAFPLLSLLSVVFLVAGARKQGRLAVTARRSGGILALCLAAVACLAWSGYAASATDATTGKLFPAVGEVIAGGDPVDVAVGNLLTDGIVEPLWTMAQVGDMSPEAVAVGRRLRAASVYVAGEDTGTATTGTKIGHYRQTAAEWQTANPAAYQEGLAGTSTGRRVEWTSVAFLGALLAAGPLLVALVVWVVFATLLELAPRVLPIAAAFLQFPGWQRHAAAAGRYLGKWSMIGVGGIVVCIVWTAIVSGVLAQTGTPIMARIGSLLLLVAVPLVCWRFRALALKRLGISKEAKHGRRGLDWAADRTPYLGARRRARREADAEETDDGPSRAGRTGGDVPEAVAEVEHTPEPTDSEWEYAAFEATRRERDETRRDQWVSADDTEPEDFDLDDVYEATAATNPAVLKLETAEADELARRAATRAPAKAGAVMPEPSPDREPVLAGSHKVVK